MSRIGNKPIKIEDGVTIQINESSIDIKGSKGELTVKFDTKHVNLSDSDGYIIVKSNSTTKSDREKQGRFQLRTSSREREPIKACKKY